MTVHKKLLLLIVILAISFSVLLPAQDKGKDEEVPQKIELYTLGDQDFSISAGLIIPLFFLDLSPASINSTHLSLGGTGSLLYEAYLNNNFKIGLELGGMFAYSPNKNPLFMVPITARAAYEFHFGQFSMPVYLGLGVNIISYNGTTVGQFLMKPGISLYWNYNSEWAFGGSMTYWICPELVLGDNQDESGINNFLDFTISARYHF